MKKIILIPLLFLFTIQFNAQDLELIVGRNFTTYDYTNSEGGSNPNLDGASGSYIEVSYNVPFNRSQDFYYSLGLALNQFNATGFHIPLPIIITIHKANGNMNPLK